MSFETINPYTEEVLENYEFASPKALQLYLEEAEAEYNKWQKLSLQQRCEKVLALAQNLKNNKNNYARQISLEMGKPITQAQAEVEKCALLCEYYAKNTPQFLQKEIINTQFKESYVRFDSLGVVLGIMPWNFPFWQVFRFAVPALLVGNTVLCKHSENTTGCGQRIQNIFTDCGFGKSFQMIISRVEDVSGLIASPVIKGVSLTGSERAGRSVAQTAGQHLKKTVLELGGSDPYIVLKDAQLNSTVKACVKSRLTNSGQSCVAAKRFIVHESLHEPFIELLKTNMKDYLMGDPLDEKTQLGPLARLDLQKQLHSQVQLSIQKGAKPEMGCEPNTTKGFFYPASIISQVQPGMPAFEEELFGPVASVISFSTVEEAIKLANSSSYGLGSAVFSEDTDFVQNEVAPYIESGLVAINGMVASTPELPFGGVKNSGFGRELSHYGLREFANIKTVMQN